jgi:hypothetical protein
VKWKEKLRRLGLVSERVRMRQTPGCLSSTEEYSNGRISPLRFFPDYSMTGQCEPSVRANEIDAVFEETEIETELDGSSFEVYAHPVGSASDRIESGIRIVANFFEPKALRGLI